MTAYPNGMCSPPGGRRPVGEWAGPARLDAGSTELGAPLARLAVPVTE